MNEEIMKVLKNIEQQLMFNNKAALTLNEAKEYSGIGRNNLRDMCDAGIIAVKWIGGKRLIPKWAIDDYLENGDDYVTENGAVVKDLSRK